MITYTILGVNFYIYSILFRAFARDSVLVVLDGFHVPPIRAAAGDSAFRGWRCRNLAWMDKKATVPACYYSGKI